MFNNCAIAQGADHTVPTDIYLPDRPPLPQMPLDAILKLHDRRHHPARDNAPQERRLCVMHRSDLIYGVMPVVILLALLVYHAAIRRCQRFL